MVVYKEPTAQFNPKFEIAALYIEHEDKILLLHRQDHKSEGNKWGIPGGKVEKGETPLTAILRETYEETGLIFSSSHVEPVSTVFIESNPTFHFVYHMFRTKMSFHPDAIKINKEEHKAFAWLTPEESLKLSLIEDEDACFKLVYQLA